MPIPHLRLPSPDWLRWPRRTARLRFTVLYSGLFLLSGAGLVAITYVLFERATEYTKPHLPQIPHTPALANVSLPQLPTALAHLKQDQSQLSQAQHQLTLLYGSGSPQDLSLPPPGSHLVTPLAQDQEQLTHDQHQLSLAVNQVAQAVHQIAQAGSVQAAQRAADSHQLLINSGIALAIAAVLALLAGWLIAGRMLRPIRTITRTAQRISSSSLHERLALDGPPDELKELGDTLDDLFRRLEAAFEAQRHFVANASHELRTPLTAERNLLQVALDDPNTSADAWRSTAEELLNSNDEQKHLIEALLALASSESGLKYRERTDLAEICQSVLARRVLDADMLTLHVETAIGPALLEGDPRLVERLVANLADNAISHNIAGGHLQISTETTDGKAVLTVTNTGPIIPPNDIDRLFRPFQRLDPRRTHHKNGHGLGLSIVQAIATTHHAVVDTSPLPGGGLSVTVTFPQRASPISIPQKKPRTRRYAASQP
jgi:signal transduction histidine kinase